MAKRTSLRGKADFLKPRPRAKPDEPRNQEKKNSSPRLVKMNLQVTPERAQQLKVYAAEHKKKLYQIIEEALSRYMD